MTIVIISDENISSVYIEVAIMIRMMMKKDNKEEKKTIGRSSTTAGCKLATTPSILDLRASDAAAPADDNGGAPS